MSIPSWVIACSKTQLLSFACIFGLVINFVIFRQYSLPSSSSSQTDNHFPELGIRDIESYIKVHQSNLNYNGHDIVFDVRKVLNILSKSHPASLPVLRDIILSVRDRKDVLLLLEKIQKANFTFPKISRVDMSKGIDGTETVKPKCPENPPGLYGRIASNMASIWPVWLEKNYANLEGGHFAPEECKAIEKTAIIIPFRNRHIHLHTMLNNLLPVLMRQQIDFRIFVIEQKDNTTFNRGMLLNAGYLEALKIDNYDCFIFHDVDMIALNDNCLYRCSSHPRHLTAAISKWKYGLPYKTYIGGAIAFTKDQFRNINGCSNLFFGWGGEDDDLRARILKFGYKVHRYPKEIGRFDTIAHLPDSGNSPNPDRIKLIESSRGKRNSEGLNTVKYKNISVEFKPLYTWISVQINMSEILQGRILKRKDNLIGHE